MSDIPDIAARLARMIRLPTVSAELDARGMAPFDEFVALLEELYPRVHARLQRERITDFGLLFRWRGRSDADPVVLMAHYDVVPVDADDWSTDPFGGEIVDGYVHGRGALDDKGPLIVILEAVEALLEDEFVPARDVYLSFGGNEETFGDAAQQIATTLASRGIRPWLVIDEGGAIVEAPLPFVSGRAAMIGVGEKGILSLRLDATSDAGHASAPRGKNAIDLLARAATRLAPSTFPPRTPPAITRMLGVFVDRSSSGAARILLRVLSRSRALTGVVFALIGGEPAALVRTTIAATMQAGGSAANVIPSSASLTLNLRLIAGDTVASAARRVRRRIRDRRVSVTVVEGADPTPLSPADGDAFDAIRDAVAYAYPDALPAPYIMMQASDARHFHRVSDHVYRFAPLEMSAAQRASIHGVDERVSISSLESGREFHVALIRGLR